MSISSAVSGIGFPPFAGAPASTPLSGAAMAGLPPVSLDTQPGLAPAEKTALGQAGMNFGSVLANQIQNVAALQQTADVKATQAATGDLSDIHDYMIASNEAALATELTVAVRNKAVEAFTEIMRMNI